MARLIDIASHQSVTDADAVARTDVEGAWIKLTGELGYENPKRDQQVGSLRDAGLAVGGYHFGDPRVDAATQARHFGADAARLGLLSEGSLFPMFDAENAGGLTWSSPGQLNTYIRVWRDVLRSEFGVLDFLVYGSESWFTSGWIDPDVWGDAHAWNWIANYNGRPGVLTLGWAHSQDALHQWRSDAVPFPGISASGLDDNVTLRGHTTESLTIGDAVPNISQTDLDKLLAAAEKLTHEFRVSDGGPGDVRPDDYPASRPDDVVGHTMTLRAWQDRHIGLSRSMNDGVARIETVVNAILNGQTGEPQVTLTDAQAQAGFESLGAQLAAQSGEALEGLYQKLVDTNSVDAVREVFAQYAGRATVALEFERQDENPSTGG